MWSSATVTVADVVELRAEGLTEEEVWSLLCQAVQTLQELFLSEEVVTEDVVPLVTPQTLGISNRGKVVVSLVLRLQVQDEEFLAPEYATMGSVRVNTIEWEKMWVYSLGKTLRSSLNCSLTKAESLTVLDFMTEENPVLRASLMSLLNVISEHRNTNLPLKPFSHLVMDMYREVFGTPPQCLLPFDLMEYVQVTKTKTPPGSTFQPSTSTNSTGKTCSRTSSATTGSDSSRISIPIRRNPVQRAPSRLYRGPTTTDTTTLRPPTNTYIGPEFVVRRMEPLKIINLGDVKSSQRKSLTVILLTGQRVQINCDPQSTTCGKIFEILVQIEKIEDNYIFGLASLINGDFVFLPSEMKIHKVAPPGWKERDKKPKCFNFFLYVRVKFFLPSLRGLKSGNTKHLLYLQLRRSLIEQQIKCELKELLALGGLALQAEFGNYDEEEHGTCSYFLLEHYLPEELIEERSELEKQLQLYHKSRSGLDPVRAEEIFVAQVQRLPEYGSHHYTSLWVRKSVSIAMWVTINPQGVYLYEKKKSVLDRKIHEAFIWKNIQGLSCNENYFRLVPHDVCGQKVTCYKLRMDNKKSYFLFRLASFHHQFFLKLRIELSPLHALSQEFGIPLEKDPKTIYYLEHKTNKTQELIERNTKRTFVDSCRDIEERQNKENENPLEKKKEKRVGVKMGVRAINSPPKKTPEFGGRRHSFSEISNTSSDAYVIDSSLKSSDDKFTYDFHESIPMNLADRLNDVSWEEERILRRIRLTKDKYGSFGLEVVEGNNGGVYIENILKKKGEDEIDSVRKGDQLLSVNGVCLLNMNYSEALSVLKNAGDTIEILVSQSCRTGSRLKLLESEYLKNIRFDTAYETDYFDSKIPIGSAIR